MTKQNKHAETQNESGYASLLHGAGFSDKEAAIYEILLQNGQMGVGAILDKVAYKRGDVYNILYSLRDKGVVEQTIKSGKIEFKPTDPYRLRDYIEGRRQKLREASSSIEAVLPQMSSLYDLTTNKPSVRSYEGLEGLKLVYRELNQSGADKLLIFRSIFDDEHPEIEKTVNAQIEKQIKLNIRTFALTPLVPEIQANILGPDQERLVSRRIVEADLLPMPAQILVWNNTVAITSMKGKMISTVIENQPIAGTFRELFKYIWNKSKPFHEKVLKDWGIKPGEEKRDNL